VKILYLDFLYPEGHIRQNIEYINCLSHFSKVYVPCPKTRYNSGILKAEILKNDAFKIKEGRIHNRLSSIGAMLRSAVLTRKKNPDYIFVSTYETMAFAIGRLFFRKHDQLFLLQHFNIDELENKIKRWFFKSYMKKVDHIVFEDFIREYLIEKFKLDEKRIHVLPHQLNENLPKVNGEKKYSCVGLSNSNDEKIIAEIINIEKQYGILKQAKRRVVLKSKTIEFDNGYLKVFKGYIADDEYNEYIDHSECLYMPFSMTFRYRMSGTLVDALSNNKIVLGSDIPLMRYYANKYPSACKIVYGAKDIFEYILKLETDDASGEFKQFKESHSSKIIIERLRSIFRRIDIVK
jgi:hypothetical protein